MINRLQIVLMFISSVSMAQEPSRIYVSTDRGVNFEPTRGVFPVDATINSWTMHHLKLFAGTDVHGILVSSDGLKSWVDANNGLPKSCRIISMLSFRQLLFIGTYREGTFSSMDDGLSWQPSSTGLKNLTVRSLAFVGPVLVAGTNDGIYSSANEGKTWTLQMGGLQLNDFATWDGQIFAATHKGIIKSSDFGDSWSWIFNEGAIFDLAVDDSAVLAMDFFGNVWKSPRNTITWLKADVYLPFQYTFRLSPSSRKFLSIEWKEWQSYSSIRDNKNHGLPSATAFDKILSTPFGLIAASNIKTSEQR
jgi:hypothetical protein